MIAAVATAAVPLILASLGGLISEKAGVLNISLEGCMTAGAFTAVLMVAAGVPVPAALAAAAAAGALLGLLLAFMHLNLDADLFIAGLGINLLVPAVAGMTSQYLWGHKGNIRMPPEALERFLNAGIPLLSWAAIPLGLGLAVLLSRSAFGRRLRTAGSAPEFLTERGLNPRRTRLSALAISSSAAALAGALIALRIGAYIPGISAGRGWTALVIIWLGFRHPVGIVAASYFFSVMEIISGISQGTAAGSVTLFLALPYMAALVALVVAAIGNHAGFQRK